MVDWLINDDGIRIPHVASTPSTPVAGSTQLYADNVDGTIYQRLPNGNVSPLASAASGLHYLNSGELTTGVAQLDIDLTGYYGYELLHIIVKTPPFGNTRADIRGAFDNNITATYSSRYGDTFGAGTSSDTSSQLVFRLRAPDGNDANQSYAVWVGNIYINSHGDATTWTSASSYQLVRSNSDVYGGHYKVVGTVSTLNLWDNNGQLFPVGFKWIMYGYKIVGA